MPLDFSNLSKTQIDRALTSNNLEEVTKIRSLKELIDKIIDWFQGGIQHSTITELFYSISDVKRSDLMKKDSKRLAEFLEIREKVLPQYRDQFVLEVRTDLSGSWGFTLKTADVIIYESENNSGFLNREELPIFCAKKIIMELENTFNSMKDMLEDPRNYLESNIECMVDGKEKQAALSLILDDPAYSKANFIEIRNGSRDDVFIAYFAGGKELEFSNRASTNSELRGFLLKTALVNDEYSNLRELASDGHLTEKDVLLKYAMNVPFNNYYVPLSDKTGEILNPMELEILKSEIAPIQLGKTTVGKLWRF